MSGAQSDGSPVLAQREDGGPHPLAPLLAGLIMVGFGVVLLMQVPNIPEAANVRVGTRVFPLIVLTLYTGFAVAYLVQQVARLLRGRTGLPAERFTNAARILGLFLTLVAYTYALQPLGYMLSTAIFIVCATRLLGSKNLIRDLIVAVLLAPGVYFLFDYTLNISLPSGVIPL